jgi:hypothetical protein
MNFKTTIILKDGCLQKKINIQKTVVFKLCYLSNIFLTRLIFLRLLPWCYLSKKNKKSRC